MLFINRMRSGRSSGHLLLWGVIALLFCGIGLLLSHSFLLAAADHDPAGCPICHFLQQLFLPVIILILVGLLIPHGVLPAAAGTAFRIFALFCRPRAPPAVLPPIY